MISALRRRLGPSDKEGGPSNVGGSKIPSGVQRVNNELQKKFARGVQYNMKIVVRGDRNVGKSCLLRRLQGMNFIEEYSATEEIQVAAIHWNYKATDDVVKVDVWDVVDQSTKKRVRNSGLKLANNASATEWEEAGCDASFVDVYKGSHGVILVFDLTKLWTWEYVQKEMENVPDNLPILVLANRRDMGHHRVVTEEQIRSFVDQFNSRGHDVEGAPRARWTTASMRNAFGLKLVHLFFNIPFLSLQRETLKRQLETNRCEILSSYSELDMYQETPEADYDTFIEAVTQRRRQLAESQGARVPVATGVGAVTRQPMGGGQPIPGQYISPVKSVTPIFGELHSSGGSTTSHSPNPGSMISERKTSFEMVENDDEVYVSGTINTNNQNTNRGSASDEETNGDNQMVRMYEQDFESDDELQSKMSQSALEKKLQQPSSLKISHSPMESATPELSVTPIAFKVRMDENAVNSSEDDLYVTPTKEYPSDGLDFHVATAQTTLDVVPPISKLSVEEAIAQSSSLMSTLDLDAWLGDDTTPIATQPPAQTLCTEDSDEEIGVRVPARQEVEYNDTKQQHKKKVKAATVFKIVEDPSNLPEPAGLELDVDEPVGLELYAEQDVHIEKKPKKNGKKVLKTEGDKVVKKKKPKVVSCDGEIEKKSVKKKSITEGETCMKKLTTGRRRPRSPKSALEDFLGDPVGPADCHDYDPL